MRGAFIGLTDTTTRGALYRAVLEGLAMRAAFVVDAIAGLGGMPAPERIRLISGGARNPLLAAIKASAFGRPVTVVDASEATALGAALLGGVAGGLWPNLEVALAALDRREHSVEPDDNLVGLYRDMRRSVFDQLQPILWPVDAKLTGIAERPGRRRIARGCIAPRRPVAVLASEFALQAESRKIRVPSSRISSCGSSPPFSRLIRVLAASSPIPRMFCPAVVSEGEAKAPKR